MIPVQTKTQVVALLQEYQQEIHHFGVSRSGEWQYSHKYFALCRTNCRVRSLTVTAGNQFSINKS
jgi:hypothetical protein